VAETNLSEVNALLVQGFKAAKEGRKEEAYDLFCKVVNLDASNEHGWLYRAATTDDLSEAYVCLEKVLSLNPDNAKAQRGIERVKARLEEEAPVMKPIEGASTANPPGEKSSEGSFGDAEVVSGMGMSENALKARSELQPFNPASGNYRPEFSNQPDENDIPPAFPDTQRFSLSDSGSTKPPANYTIPQGSPTLSFRQPSGPSIPPIGSPPPFPDLPDEDREVTEGFGNASTGQRYTIPPLEKETWTPETPSEEDYNPPPAAPVVETSQADYSALRDNLRAGKKPRKEKPALQTFGGGTSTNLDRTGRRRQQRQRRSLALILGFLILIVLLLLVVFVVTRGQNQVADTSTDQGNTATVTTEGTIQVTAGTTAAGSTTLAAVTTAQATSAAPLTTAAATTARTTTPASTTTAVPITTAAPTTAAPVTTAAPATTVAPTTTAAPATTAAPGPAAPPRPVFHTVRPNENLTQLAAAYGTSIAAIVAANTDWVSLGSNFQLIGPNQGIFTNTRLAIPVNRPDFRGRAAVLGTGETLEQFAARYRTTVDRLLQLNGFATATDVKAGDPVLVG
jgi:LysM repeat protein/tetratricopeptide (TPR) repeat protein